MTRRFGLQRPLRSARRLAGLATSYVVLCVSCTRFEAADGQLAPYDGGAVTDAAADSAAPPSSACDELDAAQSPACLDESFGVFVRAGSTAGDGTRSRPFATFAEALARLDAAGEKRIAVFAAEGEYVESVQIRGGVRHLYGGFAADFSGRGQGRTIVHPPAGPALWADSIPGLRVIDVSWLADTPSNEALSQTAVVLHDVGSLSAPALFERVRIASGPGVTALAIAEPGAPATECGMDADGSAPTFCLCDGVEVSGGRGATPTQAGSRGMPLERGGSTPNLRCTPGGDGIQGDDGPVREFDGIEGVVASDGTWTQRTAASGARGGGGGGGGGGGAGAGSQGLPGGGGGAGGCGGHGGGGGAAGGSSVGMLLSNSFVRVAESEVSAAAGGDGAAAAEGGLGRAGGAGGAGITFVQNCDSFSEHGKGGAGGRGGKGAAGAAGAGGVSAAIVRWGGALEVVGTALTNDTGGRYGTETAERRARAGRELTTSEEGVLRALD